MLVQKSGLAREFENSDSGAWEGGKEVEGRGCLYAHREQDDAMAG